METSRIIPQKRETEGTMCPSFQALEMVMDKWTPKVLFLLQDGPLRYMQLKRQVGGSTQKMVTQTLRKLEKEGLVTRTVYPTSPPMVEYTLTPLGEMLQAAFQELLQWARVYTTQFQPMRESNTLADEDEGFHKK
jgi:DNA-binding HxlR family transcriptional regulator